METYVMQNTLTGEKVTCGWYEALTLRGDGWVELQCNPAPYLEEEEFLFDEF